MRDVLSYLPLLACGGVMFLCVRMMAGGHGARDNEIEELREELKRLRADEAERSSTKESGATSTSVPEDFVPRFDGSTPK